MITTVLSLLVLYIIYTWITKSGFFDKTIPVSSGNDTFNVLDMKDSEEAASLLARVDKDINSLSKSMYQKYENTDNILFSQIIDRLKSTYTTKSLKENYPRIKKKDVSYNLNKGQTLAICLREYEEPNNFHPYNEILFVSLHELAHSLNCNTSVPMCGNSYGHDDTFWRIFKILLQEASLIGIYESKDYQKNPINYCSMQITYSPLYDTSL